MALRGQRGGSGRGRCGVEPRRQPAPSSPGPRRQPAPPSGTTQSADQEWGTAPTEDRPSGAYYLLILLGWIAGLAGYLALRDRDRRMARRLLAGGIYTTVVYTAVAVVLALNTWGLPHLDRLHVRSSGTARDGGWTVGSPKHPGAVQFRPVIATSRPGTAGAPLCRPTRTNPGPGSATVICDTKRQTSYRLGPAALTGADVRRAQGEPNPSEPRDSS